MSIAAVNLSYIGQPSAPAQGQVLNSNDSGPLGKTIMGVGTAILDGSSTTFTLNWIDGVQKPFQAPTVTVGLFAAAAPATIGGVANQAVYSAAGATGQFRVGQSVVIAGFANSGNNGTFTINALTSSTIQVTNSSSVAETNYQASAQVNLGALLPVVSPSAGQNARVLVSAANVLDTAAAATTAVLSAISATGATVTISAAGSAAQTLSVFVQLYSVV